MTEGSFEKNSLGWQLLLLQQRLQEWWELTTSQPNLSQIKIPSLNPIFYQLLKALFWLIVAGLLIWASLKLWKQLEPYIYTLINKSKSQNLRDQKSDNDISVVRWLNKAKKFQQEGNYRAACRCLYMAMLQQLHDRGAVLHQLSRTDREYLQSTQNLAQASAYEKLLITHEQLYFKNSEASASLFNECQQAYQKIQAQSEER